MTPEADPADRLRAVVAAQQYMTLATADADGRPWAAPVWYAVVARPEPPGFALVWLSRPEARHSRNLEVRPEAGIAVFDSGQPAGTGTGVQLEALGAVLEGVAVDEAVEAFSAASVAAGGGPWSRVDVEGPGRPRLYLATVVRAYVLEAGAREEVPSAPPGPGPGRP